jgi:hypothetical protein
VRFVDVNAFDQFSEIAVPDRLCKAGSMTLECLQLFRLNNEDAVLSGLYCLKASQQWAWEH